MGGAEGNEGPGSAPGKLGPPQFFNPGRIKVCQLPCRHWACQDTVQMMYLPFSLHHLTRTSGRGSQEGSLKWLYACAPLGFPVPQSHCYPTHSAPCHPLTMAVGFSPPAACWRWQLKISSARFRYCAIFRFTASRRSLLGSTAVSTEGGHEVLATRPGRIPWSPGHTPQRDALDPSPFYTGPLAAVPGGMP